MTRAADRLRIFPPPGAAPSPTRRGLLCGAAMAAAFGGSGSAAGSPALGARGGPLVRRVPSTGQELPVIGLGSWITFNVGRDAEALARSTQVVSDFLAAGGRVIDSSPMYGSSQDTIGHALARLGRPASVFSAEKVWIGDGASGPAQIEQTRQRWGVPRLDLVQIHNLLAWREHLPRLLEMKAAGRIGAVGVSTSEGRRHAELETILRTQPVDVVQLSYNLLDREVESRLLPLARERGIAVLVNRPFRQGALLRDLSRHPLPGWAAEVGCTHWAQVALKFVVSHPAVTCVIPATSQPQHLRQNMAAGHGPWPDDALRRRMAADVASL